MPTQYRIGLDDKQRFPPTGEHPARQNPKETIGIFKPRPRPLALQYQKLLPKQQIFRHQPGLWLAQSRNRSRYPPNHIRPPLLIGLAAFFHVIEYGRSSADLVFAPYTGGRKNNRAENSHQPVRRRERKMQRFKSAGSAQRFLSVHAAVYNHFNIQRHLISRRSHRLFRIAAIASWQHVTLPA